MELLLLTLFFLGKTDSAVNIKFENGRSATLNLKKITADKVSGDKPNQIYELSEVDSIRFTDNLKPANSKQKFTVFGELNTVVTASVIHLNDGTLAAKSSNGTELVRIPRSFVNSIRFDNEVDEKLWSEAVGRPSSGDRLIVNRGGKLDLIEGVVKKIEETTIEFETRGKRANVQLSKLAGVAFFRVGNQRPRPKIMFTDVYGNKYGAQSVTLTDSVISLGLDKESTLKFPSQSAQLLDFTSGRFVFLDGLTPVSKKWIPFVKSRISDSEMAKTLSELGQTENRMVTQRVIRKTSNG